MVSMQILIILMIAAALIAVEAKDAFGSVIALGVLGLELSLAFLLLKAPDIAVIFLVLEMIALAVLAKAVSKDKAKAGGDMDIFSALTFAAFAALFVIVSMKAFSELPRFGSPLMNLAGLYAEQALGKTGAASVIAAAAFGFRGLDALIAFMILLLTAAGIYHITGKKE